jgi:hypothetical protein
MSRRPTAREGARRRLVRLAILDGYKVRWSRETVARDVVQNFYDEAADFSDVVIETDEAKGTVRVSGPSTFALDYLRYLGATTKRGRRTAGGFGEGFKICALVLLRDYGVEVRAGSRGWTIRPVLLPMKLGRELCYEVEEEPAGKGAPGSFVSLTGADARLVAAFASSRDLFRHPGNPRLNEPLFVDEAGGVGVYAASKAAKRGELFYRRQARGTVPFGKGAALTFAHDDAVPGIEPDRDRRTLRGGARVIAAVLARAPTDALEKIILRLRPYWASGNGVLSAALREAAKRGARFSFPKRWVASVAGGYQLSEHAERRGYHVALAAFAGAGMPTLEERFGGSLPPRRPTPAEAARVAVARDAYETLTGVPSRVRAYRVIDVASVGARYHGKTPLLRAGSLSSPFASGLADVLRMLASAAGPRAASNADRLTALLEGLLVPELSVAGWAKRWADAAGADAVDETDEPTDDEALAYAGGRDRYIVVAAWLAPPGLPPTDDVIARVERAARARGARPIVQAFAVSDERDAWETYARGVPSLWIEDTELEPIAPGPRYEHRTYTGAGGPRVTPSDEAIEAAMDVACARAGRRRGRMTERGRRSLVSSLRWLKATAPEEHRREIERRALDRAIGVLGWSDVPSGGHEYRRAWAVRELPRGAEVARLRTLAEEAAQAAHRATLALGEAFAARARALGGDAEPLVEGAFEDAASALGRGGDPAAAGLDRMPLRAAVRERAALVPLDDTCRRACLAAALRVIEEAAPGGLDGVVERAYARLEEAALLAHEHHARRDEHGDPLRCYALDLSALEGTALRKVELVATAVRRAWDEALAGGASEAEAAARAIAAAPGARAEERAATPSS